MRIPNRHLIPALVLLGASAPMAAAQQRPLDFMDVQYMKSGGAWTPSPDGSWMLYTVTTPDWQEDERQSDIHVVSMA